MANRARRRQKAVKAAVDGTGPLLVVPVKRLVWDTSG
jgi:hypothetical protein